MTHQAQNDKLAPPKAALPILDTLLTAGYQAYVVGGAVRDLCLGRPIHDVDITTDATPDVVMQLFRGAIPTAPQHGTVTIPSGCGDVCEVTTFRSDGLYTDGRHPVEVEFNSDLKADLARRDFTINAMALSRDGHIVDPYGGQNDLRLGMLRCVGNPTDRFAEDALRMLRALRFAAVYELDIEQETYFGIIRNRKNIEHVSSERIGAELLKLSRGNWFRILQVLAQSNLFDALGEPFSSLQRGFRMLLQKMDGLSTGAHLPCPQESEAIAVWFAWTHDGADKADQLCRKSAIGKDIGKHCKAIVHLVKSLLDEDDPTGVWTPEILYQYGQLDTRKAVKVAAWLCPADALVLQETYTVAVACQPIWSLADLAVNGRHISNFGVTGPAVGQILQTLAGEVLAGQIHNREDLLICEIKRLIRVQVNH